MEILFLSAIVIVAGYFLGSLMRKLYIGDLARAAHENALFSPTGANRTVDSQTTDLVYLARALGVTAAPEPRPARDQAETQASARELKEHSE